MGLWLAAFAALSVGACHFSNNAFEKNVSIPRQEWDSRFRPSISLLITDTSSPYNISLVIRHSNAYHFNNLWFTLTLEQPGGVAPTSEQFEKTLGDNNGWLGTAMDDIYEQRILLMPNRQFPHAGEYRFTIEQLMREDPLQHVFNIGIRVEKGK
jgi:gliding motility-associated lipoprotein GldH